MPRDPDWNAAEDCRPAVGSRPALRTLDGEVWTWIVVLPEGLPPEVPFGCYTRLTLRMDCAGTVMTTQGRVWPITNEDQDDGA